MPLLDRLKEKTIGGHPDHRQPDPLWEEAYSALLLAEREIANLRAEVKRLQSRCEILSQD